MSNKLKIKFELKIFVPIFILGLIVEGAIFSAFKVKDVEMWKVGVLFVAVCVCATVLTVIPFVQHIMDTIRQWIVELPINIKKNKKGILKNIILLLIVSALAFVLTKCLITLLTVQIVKYVVPGVYMISWTICFMGIFGIIYRKLLVTNIESCVAILILLMGMVFIMAEPVSAGITWDDQVHYSFASDMSYDFERAKPKAVIDFLSEATNSLDKFNTEHYDNWIKGLEKEYANPTDSTYAGCTPAYQRWVFIPMAIFLLIGRALHLSFVHVFMFGKLANVIVFSLLVYFSMKKLKAGKMLIAAIALLPEVLFQASNYSYDTWVIGWIMLGMSCFIYEIQHIDEYINIKNIILMIVAFFVGIGPKAIYVPLMCLLFFMPKKKFKSKKQRRIYNIIIVIVILYVLSTFITPFISSGGGGAGDARGGSEVNASAQTSFILHNPGAYLVICWNFFKEYVAFYDWDAMTSFFAYMGKTPFQITSVVILFAVALTDKCSEDSNMRWFHKGVVTVMSLGITVLIITAIYITFNPVQAETIAGCQPRYLLPLFFPMFYCLGSGKIENKINILKYRSIILSMCMFIALYGVWTTIICKYM